MTYRFTGEQDSKIQRTFCSDACATCPIKHQCTLSKERRIRRWEHEYVLERAQKRIGDNPDRLAIRSMAVEHPFGSIKSRMGATHFTMRRMKNVASEMALHVLAYNFKRVMRILGIPAMISPMAV